MSLIITVFVPEGIVLSGDSRLTLSWTDGNETPERQRHSITASDNNQKVFILNDRFGLATYGKATIGGVPISGYIAPFVDEMIQETTQIDELPHKLLTFFGERFDFPDTKFYVAGYKMEDKALVQHVYHVNIAKKKSMRLNVRENKMPFFGANWGGQTEILSRLVKDVKLKKGGKWKVTKAASIPYGILTLQDAIDFSLHAIRTTIETMRFQRRSKTVGGAIDILVIQPEQGCSWVRKKELQ